MANAAASDTIVLLADVLAHVAQGPPPFNPTLFAAATGGIGRPAARARRAPRVAAGARPGSALPAGGPRPAAGTVRRRRDRPGARRAARRRRPPPLRPRPAQPAAGRLAVARPPPASHPGDGPDDALVRLAAAQAGAVPRPGVHAAGDRPPDAHRPPSGAIRRPCRPPRVDRRRLAAAAAAPPAATGFARR